MLSYEERLSKNISRSKTINVLKTYYGIVTDAATNEGKRWLEHWVLDLAVALCHEFRRDFAIKLAMTILDAMELERLDKLYNLRLSAIEDCLERRQW